MHLLSGYPRHYAWGSHTAIPALIGAEPTEAPLAELWYGAHPLSPSPTRPLTDNTHDDAADLAAVISSDPQSTLGEICIERHGPALPYLMKLIAPAAPLSLQVHPDAKRARAMFAQEEAAGIDRTDPQRNYRDPHHKPELTLALEKFEALAGFRSFARLQKVLDLPCALAQELRSLIAAQPGGAGVRRAFAHLLMPATTPQRAALDEVIAASAERLAAGTSPSVRADRNLQLLAQHYPGDPAVVGSLLLNPVTLNPGEAMYLPPGMPHAYLSGLGVEIMASSDNVLRAGLTNKYRDIPEMLRCASFISAPPMRIAPEHSESGSVTYFAPVDDFQLTCLVLGDPEAIADPGLSAMARALAPADHREHTVIPSAGPRIVVVLCGDIEISAGGQSPRLTAGQAVFVSACDGPITVRGRGMLLQANVA